ncbi:helix-turn-helix transcriptional regulator [Burkholderia multivorans]|uniref:helix-turn-helix transcriptional regulator n=1 Tax=Burkholderia multivorans TaxID=87883 RepID=UPI0021C17D5D|nr:AlpA family phage regulatory protein [Burkholderia multivorans]
MIKHSDIPDEAQFVSRTVVEKMTNLSKTQIYALIQKNKFPRQVHLSERSVAWVLSEIIQWIEDRKRDRDSKYQDRDFV